MIIRLSTRGGFLFEVIPLSQMIQTNVRVFTACVAKSLGHVFFICGPAAYHYCTVIFSLRCGDDESEVNANVRAIYSCCQCEKSHGAVLLNDIGFDLQPRNNIALGQMITAIIEADGRRRIGHLPRPPPILSSEGGGIL